VSVGAAVERADFLSADEIGRIQRLRWQHQAEYVASQSGFYRTHFGTDNLTGDLTGLQDLPLTDKDMLRADQRAHPPFGSYLASGPERISRVHRTSGTTGVASSPTITPPAR